MVLAQQEITWGILWCWKKSIPTISSQWEFTWELPGVAPASSSCGVIWGSSHCPGDMELLHQWLVECWQLLECWQLVDWLILSICLPRVAAATRAHWWASLARAIISSSILWFAAVNYSYIPQFMAVNAVWGSGQWALAGNCIHCFLGSGKGHLTLRYSFIETRTSW